MKKIIFIIMVCLSFTAVDAQTNNDLEKAIQHSLDSLVRQKQALRLVKKLSISTKGFPPNFKFKDTINEVPIKYTNLATIMASKKETKKGGIHVTVLSELSLDKNKLKIRLTNHSMMVHKRRELRSGYYCNIIPIDKAYFLSISIMGETNFTYEYSGEKQEWILTDAKVYRY